MLGMFGGGWKLGGKPAGRPGCWAFADCIPGGGVVPGATIPGGGAIKLVTDSKWGIEEIMDSPMPGGAPG